MEINIFNEPIKRTCIVTTESLLNRLNLSIRRREGLKQYGMKCRSQQGKETFYSDNWNIKLSLYILEKRVMSIP